MENLAGENRTTVFISYSRKDKSFVEKLHQKFVDAGFETWVDWEGIPPSADWWQEIQQGVDSSDAFAFIISPDSLTSKVCQDEIEAAVEHNKRLIPILHREPLKENKVHPKISAHNWVFMQDDEELEKNFEKMVATINTDLEWVKAHTRLLGRAVEWDKNGHNASYLLRGDDLKIAEAWLGQAEDKDPKPTELQAQYIYASRRNAARRRRITIFGIAIAVVISFLAVLAFYQRAQATQAQAAAELARGEAEVNAVEAREQEELAVEAQATAVAAAHEADIQRELAEVQRDIASENRARAEAQEAIAKEQEQIAKDQEAIALEEAEKARIAEAEATDLKEEALALRTAITGELLRQQDKLTLSTLVAVESLLQRPTDEGEQLLRNLLSRLPAGQAKLIHGDWINTAAFSPDERLILSAGRDGNLIIWDLEVGAAAYLLTLDGPIVDAAFNSQGDKFVTGVNNKVVVWDTETGEKFREFEADAAITAVDFAPDGDHVGASTENGFGTVWNILTNDRTFNGVHRDEATGITFSPGGNFIVTTSRDGRGFLWNVSNPATPASLPHNGAVTGAAFSPDGSRVLTYGEDNTARIWNTNTRLLLARLIHDGVITDATFSPDGSLVATASADGTAGIWVTETGRSLNRLTHTDFVNSVAFSPNGDLVVSGSDDKIASIWDVASGEEVSRLVHDSPVWDVTFNKSGQFLATATQGGTLEIWDVTKDNPVIGRAPHDSFVTDIAYTDDGSQLVTVGEDGKVHFWESADLLSAATTAMETRLFELGTPLQKMALGPQGQLFAVTGEDQGAYLIDTTNEEVRLTISDNKRVNDLAFTPDGTSLILSEQTAAAGGESIVKIIDVETGEERANLEQDVRIWAVAVSPDGTLLATAGDDGLVRVFSSDLSEQLHEPFPHNEEAVTLAFSPDGQILASGSADDTVRIWDITEGVQLAVLTHNGTVNDIAFSPGGELLLTGSDDQNLRIWESDGWHEVARIPHTDRVTAVAIHPDSRFLVSSSNILATLWDLQEVQYLQPEDLVTEACSRLVRNLTFSEWEQYVVFEGDEEATPYRPVCPGLPSEFE